MARDGREDNGKERSRKRKTPVDEDQHSKRREDENGKRKHKHRKHKHRSSSHRKHKEMQIVVEAEDGEILEPMDGPVADGIVSREDGYDSSESEKAVHEEVLPKSRESPVRQSPVRVPRSRSRDGTPDPDKKRRPSTSPDRKYNSPDRRVRGSSVDRKRRSRSKESVRDHGRHHNRVASPDRKRRRSRSKDRAEDRSRRHAFSPERRRRSRSKERDDRDRYSRRRGDSHDRNYRDDRGRDDGKYHRDRAASRRDQEEEKKETVHPDKGIEREEENQEEYLERVAHQLAEQEEDIEKVKEESRRRRQAIMEKHKKQQQNQLREEPAQNNEIAQLPAAEPDSGEGIIDPSTPLSLSLGKPAPPNGTQKKAAGGLGEGSPPKSEKPADMFCDIFGDSPAEISKLGTRDALTVDTSGLTDNWDDPDGYYTYRVGEVLDNRYEIASSHGRGVFSTVVRARDSKAGPGEPEEVAIKIIRSNDTMFKAGLNELVILKKLAGADLENKRHCVRLLSSFEYRNHLCLVFESLHMNLREILKKFGRNIGISLAAVQSYAKQLFTALKHLRNCGVLHCDIKPDNMLVNDSKNLLKLCDFGSAMFAGENEITPYLVSRFYRAPEIILGLPYDHALDMWSVGCCLYELYTGKVLFPGPTNNDMLRLHMELKGPFPKKMLRKAAFTSQHFDQDLNFHAIEEDPVTKKTINRLITNVKPKDLSTLISSSGCPDDLAKHISNFKSLLEKVFILDPEKRLTVHQAVHHPFITQQIHSSSK